MTDHLILEIGLALLLIAFAGALSNRFRYSIVPFLILVGMAVGPHAPHVGILDFRFIESQILIDFMGRLGVLLLMFSLGLELSVGRLLRSGGLIARSGTVYIVLNLALGLLYPWLLGWPFEEILVVAGITTISSSAIVAKVLVDLRRTACEETEMILGILMFEDIFLAVYLSIISGLVLSGSSSPGGIAASVGLAFGFMIGLLVAGRLAVPWLNRVLDIESGELFLLVVFAALLLISGLAETLHVAEAIGALLVGLILSETVHRKRIEQIVVPFRDLLGALFFFSFGLSIDPLKLGGAVWVALGAVLLTIIGNYAAGMIAGSMARLPAQSASRIGLTIVSRGEFSIIMANLGQAGGLSPRLQPFAALYVLTLAVVGPLLAKRADRIRSLLDAVVPAPGSSPRPAHRHPTRRGDREGKGEVE
jgi:CPA2 family monovalent cation:H+ antiporter-2